MRFRFSEFLRRGGMKRASELTRRRNRARQLERLEDRTLLASYLTGPQPGAPFDIAMSYLSSNGQKWGFQPADAARSIVTSQYTDTASKISHIYLMQSVDGLAVQNSKINVNIGRYGEVISIGGRFDPSLGLRASTNPPAPAITAADAVASAAGQLGLGAGVPVITLSKPTGLTQRQTVSAPAFSRPIDVELAYVSNGNGAALTWNMVLTYEKDHQYYAYHTDVSADTGAILGKSSWVSEANDASYQVFPLPVTDPGVGTRQLLLNPQDPAASPFGWHDVNGVVGADFTTTRGNNVDAYTDRQGAFPANGNGQHANGGPNLNFSFPLDLSGDPSTYRQAATTNLFYLANVAHDIHFKYGFDEASGNFQALNYTGQGQADDPVFAVNAFGADTGSLNNAFMFTPPDGQSPTIAMYLWSYTNPQRDGSLSSDVVIHEFGHGVSTRLTGGPADSDSLDAIQSGGMGEGWSDWWALMFSMESSDSANTPRPVANYVTGQPPTGGGLRRFPYSVDMATDPLTIEYYNQDPFNEVHNTGEIWTSTLWDMNWFLIQKYGFDPDIAQGYQGQGSAGNILALQLVMDALKLQPSNPSFGEARDAILMADQNLTGGANQFEIWKAFARRGMGFSFNDHGAGSTTVDPAFDLPPILFVQYVNPPSVPEGQALTNVQIASFFDPNTGQPVTNYAATIDWGDGSPQSTGTVTANANGGFDVSVATKTYQEGGDYPITVTVTNTVSQQDGQNGGTYHVIDSPLVTTAGGFPIVVVEGTSFSQIVGSFVDQDFKVTTPGVYTSLVDLGDGSAPVAGVLSPTSGGGDNAYDVGLSATYPTAGQYTYTATTTGPGGSQSIIVGQATVTIAPLTASLVAINPIEGKIFSGVVARFTSANPGAPITNFSGTIDWGNGRTTPALISRDPSGVGFTVSGSNRYFTFGDYTVHVIINDRGTIGADLASTVSVIDAPLHAVGTSFGVVEGQPFSGTVATLSDENLFSLASEFTATIDWGDGVIDQGQVIASGGGNGAFVIRGTHTFQDQPGPISVHVTDAGPSFADATTTVTVTEAALAVVGTTSYTGVEGLTVGGLLATFSDANPLARLSDFTATITWGDGSQSSGGISKTSGGLFQVSDAHTYQRFGQYPISILINNEGLTSIIATTSATISDAPFTASGVGSIQATEGQIFPNGVVVATFLDTNSFSRLGDFSATISWGDGTSTGGTIQDNGAAGSYSVVGSHIFPVGQFPIRVVVVSSGGLTASADSSFSVQNAPLTPIGAILTLNEGERFNGVVGQFIDGNPNSRPVDFKGTINWGDGTSSAASILSAGNSTFDVRGSHLYKQGIYTIVVSVSDNAGGSVTIQTQANVPDAPLTIIQLPPVTAQEGVAFTGVVAEFRDGDPTSTAQNFTVDINWGDGTQSPGQLSPRPGGGFQVTGSHTYAFRATPYTATTTITSNGGNVATADTTVNVPNSSITVFPRDITAQEGVAFAGTVANFFDPNPQGVVGDYTATIQWGDGIQSLGTIIQDGIGRFHVDGGHTYPVVQDTQITIVVQDPGGGVFRAVGKATITNAPITVTPAAFSVTEDIAFNGVVATFTDANPNSRLEDFSAVVAWGDGDVSTGVIQGSTATGYTVTASHTYANPGPIIVAITVEDNEGGKSVASVTVNVADQLFPITGVLDAGSDRGASIVDGITNVNQPIFRGTAEPGARVTLTGQRPDMLNPVVIGAATADPAGNWAILTSPLFDGSYTIVGSAIDQQGRTSSPPIALRSAFNPLVIDTVGPRITRVRLQPRTGRAVITVQDDASGMSPFGLIFPFNFSLALGRKGTPLTVTDIAATPGGPTDPRTIVVEFARGRRLRAAAYTLGVDADGLTDVAGNKLDERFFTPTPGQPGSAYLAQIVSNGDTATGPIKTTQKRRAARASAAAKIRTTAHHAVPKARTLVTSGRFGH